TAITLWPRLQRRFAKPAASRSKVFSTSREGWHNQYDSKDRSTDPGVCAARLHTVECIYFGQTFNTNAKDRGASTRKLKTPGGYFRGAERPDRHGNRPARISAYCRPFIFATLH